ncbi:hypothetical protein F2P81_011702 [Scophthalmus maximus]|uniref:Beta-catenin-interacting protein 1 n=1 Tax=Scophthalmus maximus TaxID=52904 RepID=A0A6A4SWY2_SCOMX|nr:hypothetical protein F2P81_011702 [Scophthalmus maximus]
MNREEAPGKSPEDMYIQQKVRVLLMLKKMGSNLTPSEEAFLRNYAGVVHSQMSQLPQHNIDQELEIVFIYRRKMPHQVYDMVDSLTFVYKTPSIDVKQTDDTYPKPQDGSQITKHSVNVNKPVFTADNKPSAAMEIPEEKRALAAVDETVWRK